MTISDARDLFKEICPNLTEYFVGKYNAQLSKVINLKRGVSVQRKAIGGMKQTSYSSIACNCIFVGTDNCKETDELAYSIRESLLKVGHPEINGFKVIQVILRNFVEIGINEKENYEYAIDFEIVYQRKQEE